MPRDRQIFLYTNEEKKRRIRIRACLGNTFVAALIINREFTRARAHLGTRREMRRARVRTTDSTDARR